jgi:hypothetical protein
MKKNLVEIFFNEYILKKSIIFLHKDSVSEDIFLPSIYIKNEIEQSYDICQNNETICSIKRKFI